MKEVLASNRCRWFIKKGSTTTYTEGFRSKKDALDWVKAHPDLDWMVGGTFKLLNDKRFMWIKNRKGETLTV